MPNRCRTAKSNPRPFTAFTSGLSSVVRRVFGGDSNAIVVRGQGDLLVYRARCCNPIRGESIVGYVTRGKGVAVHSVNCPNVTNLLYEPDRRIDVLWAGDKDGQPVSYPVKLTLLCDDRWGMLKQITAVISDTKTNIRSMESRSQNGQASIDVRRGNGSSRIPDVDSGFLRSAPEAGRTQALSARAHARAAVPLQPGLRRMRQDPVPRPHPENDLSPEDCFKAVDECGAPMVSIPGGEPLMHPQIDKIVEGLVARKKYIYLCTNALLLKEKLHLFKPSKYLSFSVHVDGQKEHHDFSVCREGGYELALDGIRAAIVAPASA
jgi:hypothetical protein